jgi:hypothetical protein
MLFDFFRKKKVETESVDVNAYIKQMEENHQQLRIQIINKARLDGEEKWFLSIAKEEHGGDNGLEQTGLRNNSVSTCSSI